MTKYSNTDSDLIGTWQLWGSNSAIKSVVPVSRGSMFFPLLFSQLYLTASAWGLAAGSFVLLLIFADLEQTETLNRARAGAEETGALLKYAPLGWTGWGGITASELSGVRVVWQGVGNRGWGGGVKAVSHEMKVLPEKLYKLIKQCRIYYWVVFHEGLKKTFPNLVCPNSLLFRKWKTTLYF